MGWGRGGCCVLWPSLKYATLGQVQLTLDDSLLIYMIYKQDTCLASSPPASLPYPSYCGSSHLETCWHSAVEMDRATECREKSQEQKAQLLGLYWWSHTWECHVHTHMHTYVKKTVDKYIILITVLLLNMCY